ncbi:hypothetical protein B4100_0775 [Heyndrickxia coagulans]|nr:hypothetical protein B4100_0775 [Heyndrickxia coagulans]
MGAFFGRGCIPGAAVSISFTKVLPYGSALFNQEDYFLKRLSCLCCTARLLSLFLSFQQKSTLFSIQPLYKE